MTGSYTPSLIRSIISSPINVGKVVCEYGEAELGDKKLNGAVRKEFFFPHLVLVEEDLLAALMKKRYLRATRRLQTEKEISARTMGEFRKPLNRFLCCHLCDRPMIYRSFREGRFLIRCGSNGCGVLVPAETIEDAVFGTLADLGLSSSGPNVFLVESVEAKMTSEIDRISGELSESRARLISLAPGAPKRARLARALADGTMGDRDYKAAVEEFDRELAEEKKRFEILEAKLSEVSRRKKDVSSILSKTSIERREKSRARAREFLEEKHGPVPSWAEKSSLAINHVKKISTIPFAAIEEGALSEKEKEILSSRGVAIGRTRSSRLQEMTKSPREEGAARRRPRIRFDVSVELLSGRTLPILFSNPSIFIPGVDDPALFPGARKKEGSDGL